MGAWEPYVSEESLALVQASGLEEEPSALRDRQRLCLAARHVPERDLQRNVDSFKGRKLTYSMYLLRDPLQEFDGLIRCRNITKHRRI